MSDKSGGCEGMMTAAEIVAMIRETAANSRVSQRVAREAGDEELEVFCKMFAFELDRIADIAEGKQQGVFLNEADGGEVCV